MATSETNLQMVNAIKTIATHISVRDDVRNWILFTGDRCAEKTVAAGLLSEELGIRLLRIDLSHVANSYIGETEKNLRRLFDAAETEGAILFLDEADALFGKRSSIRDYNEHRAYGEIGILVERIMKFNGPVVLAVDSRNDLYESCARKLRFEIMFPSCTAVTMIEQES